MDKRGNNGEFLLHSVRIRRDGGSEIARDAELFRVTGDTLAADRFRDLKNIADEIQILYTRHEFVNIGVIGQIRCFFLARNGVFLYIDAVDRYRPPRKFEYTRAGLDRRRFSRAVMTDKSENVARTDFKGQIVNGVLFSVVTFGIMTY